jgi:hypothetical protein
LICINVGSKNEPFLLKRSYEVGVGFAWPCFAYVLLRKVQSMHENFGEARTAVLAGPGKRDLRLDLLRGIGQFAFAFPERLFTQA